LPSFFRVSFNFAALATASTLTAGQPVSSRMSARVQPSLRTSMATTAAVLDEGAAFFFAAFLFGLVSAAVAFLAAAAFLDLTFFGCAAGLLSPAAAGSALLSSSFIGCPPPARSTTSTTRRPRPARPWKFNMAPGSAARACTRHSSWVPLNRIFGGTRLSFKRRGDRTPTR
jgi:hypothetical protein